MVREKEAETGSASHHYLAALHEAATKQGLDADQLLTQSGIDKSLLNRSGCRVPTERLADFQLQIWREMNDESMGVLSNPLHVGTYYMLGKLAVSELTLHKAIKIGMRLYNVISGRELIRLSTEGNLATLSFHLPQPERDHKHLFAEMSMLAWHRLTSWLIADLIPLTETHFPFEPPKHVAEYNYLFPGNHKFCSDMLSMVFPVDYLCREIRQDSNSLKTFMQRCPTELFLQYKADYNLSADLRYLLSKDIGDNDLTIESAATFLHLTPRTLMRRLKNEGTSFQQIKDLVRRDKASLLLTQQHLPIKMVAEKMGFSDPAVFTRAFRRWTGLSPRQYRSHTVI